VREEKRREEKRREEKKRREEEKRREEKRREEKRRERKNKRKVLNAHNAPFCRNCRGHPDSELGAPLVCASHAEKTETASRRSEGDSHNGRAVSLFVLFRCCLFFAFISLKRYLQKLRLFQTVFFAALQEAESQGMVNPSDVTKIVGNWGDVVV
jgi:hypothetical protein